MLNSDPILDFASHRNYHGFKCAQIRETSVSRLVSSSHPLSSFSLSLSLSPHLLIIACSRPSQEKFQCNPCLGPRVGRASSILILFKMRSSIATSALFTFSAFWTLSSSLPLAEHRANNRAPIAPRYSVVPINGGSDSGGSDNGAGSDGQGGSHDAPVTVVETVLSTVPPKTVGPHTKTSPAKTGHGISTVDIHQTPGTKTKTSVIYVTPSPSKTPVTSCSTEPTSSTPPHHTSKPTSTRSAYPTSTSSSSTQSSSSQASSSRPSSSTSATYQPPSTSIPLSTAYSSTKTYDNGMWHTMYPSWNETTARGAPRRL